MTFNNQLLSLLRNKSLSYFNFSEKLKDLKLIPNNDINKVLIELQELVLTKSINTF